MRLHRLHLNRFKGSLGQDDREEVALSRRILEQMREEFLGHSWLERSNQVKVLSFCQHKNHLELRTSGFKQSQSQMYKTQSVQSSTSMRVDIHHCQRPGIQPAPWQEHSQRPDELMECKQRR